MTGLNSNLGPQMPSGKEKQTTVSYFFIIFFGIGAILAGTIAVLYNLETEDYMSNVKTNERAHITLQQRVIASNFSTIVADLRFFSHQNELLHWLDQSNETHAAEIATEYAAFLSQKGIYDQIRFLDDTGMEKVRANYNQGEPAIVPQHRLQNKGSRYYFKDSIVLSRNEVFVSPFDLNIEGGEIEKPLKPMIRFGIPVFDGQERKRGILIFNYLGKELIAAIVDAAKMSAGDIMLINSDGYWMYCPNEHDRWGFMIKERESRKFSTDFPQAWQHMAKESTGQVLTEMGLFTFGSIYPLMAGMLSSTGSSKATGDSKRRLKAKDYQWKIVSHLPKSQLTSGIKGLQVKLFFLGGALFILASVPSWLIAQFLVRRKLHQIELYRSANFDRLTGLPNRSLFMDRLSQNLKQAVRYNRKFALLFIDLDGFKAVNDTLGHDAGDELLIQTAKRLSSIVRDSDTVARMGGDEFTIILSTISSPENAGTVAGKIVEILSQEFEIKGNKAKIGASIGVSICPDHGDDPDGLIKKADDAMYEAKAQGKNDYRFSS